MSVEVKIVQNLLSFSYLFFADSKVNQAIFILFLAFLFSNSLVNISNVASKAREITNENFKKHIKETNLERGSFIEFKGEKVLIIQHGNNIYSIGYALNVNLSENEEKLARKSLRETTLESDFSSTFGTLINTNSITSLGIGGNLTDENHFWAYFHNCKDIEYAEEVVSGVLYFSGSVSEIHKALVDKKCTRIKILYGVYEWPPNILNELVLEGIVKKLYLQENEIKSLLHS